MTHTHTHPSHPSFNVGLSSKVRSISSRRFAHFPIRRLCIKREDCRWRHPRQLHQQQLHQQQIRDPRPPSSPSCSSMVREHARQTNGWQWCIRFRQSHIHIRTRHTSRATCDLRWTRRVRLRQAAPGVGVLPAVLARARAACAERAPHRRGGGHGVVRPRPRVRDVLPAHGRYGRLRRGARPPHEYVRLDALILRQLDSEIRC